MTNLAEKIKQKASEYFDQVVEIRRHLHANPELSFQEVETGKYIASILRERGVEFTSGWAGHGLVAILKGSKDSERVIALRADIDALPITEENDVPYQSKNDGIMHACGHDVHTSSLLGSLFILQDLQEYWGGTIKFIFQPGEEKLPGGASIMIKEGVLKNPAPEHILGQHVHPPLEAGQVGIRAGKYMASADEIYLTVKGRGGHAALPQNCIDTVLMSARIIDSLQSVVSRSANPFVPSVLSFGKINSVGGATNVIPDEVKIEGTFRTMNEEWRAEAHQLIREIAENTAKSLNGNVEVNIVKGYPFLHNEEKLTATVKKNMISFLGKENVIDLPMRMTAEDFSFYGQTMPGCFYRLGTGNKSKGISSPVHTTTFDIDESALETGIGLMAFLAMC